MGEVKHRPPTSVGRRNRTPDDKPSPGTRRGQLEARTADQRDKLPGARRPEYHAASSALKGSAKDRPRVPAVFIARRAIGLVARLSGRRPESVISLERTDGAWRVGVEVVEVPRIPDSADILAVYDVLLDTDGGLISFRRIRRYARGHLDWEHRR